MGCEFLKSALARSSETLPLGESGGSKCKENRRVLVRPAARDERGHGPSIVLVAREGQGPLDAPNGPKK